MASLIMLCLWKKIQMAYHKHFLSLNSKDSLSILMQTAKYICWATFQANSQKRGSEVKERRTNLKADELPSETVKQILFGEMINDPLQGIQKFWGQGQLPKNMWLLPLSGYLYKVTWACVFLRQNFLKNVLSTCMYSICRVEVFYQFLQCTVPDKFERDELCAVYFVL